MREFWLRQSSSLEIGLKKITIFISGARSYCMQPRPHVSAPRKAIAGNKREAPNLTEVILLLSPHTEFPLDTLASPLMLEKRWSCFRGGCKMTPLSARSWSSPGHLSENCIIFGALHTNHGVWACARASSKTPYRHPSSPSCERHACPARATTLSERCGCTRAVVQWC